MKEQHHTSQAAPRVLVGMVHLGRMLDSHGLMTVDEVESNAVRDALTLARAGFNAVLLENLGDTPYHPENVPPHIVAGMTRIAVAVRRSLDACDKGDVQIGVQVLRNDARAALGIAAAVGAGFIRINVHSGAMVTDQGIIQGKAHETCPYRDLVAPDCQLWADVRVKHASSIGSRPIEDEAQDLVSRAHASAVVVTGNRTGGEIDLDELARVREAVPAAMVVAGSGVSLHNYASIMPHVGALIVGSSLKSGGKVEAAVDAERADTLVEGIRRWERNHGVSG